jgi:hypothetical protein
LLETSKKFEKLTAKKCPKFKKKKISTGSNLKEFEIKRKEKRKRKIVEVKWLQFSS